MSTWVSIFRRARAALSRRGAGCDFCRQMLIQLRPHRLTDTVSGSRLEHLLPSHSGLHDHRRVRIQHHRRRCRLAFAHRPARGVVPRGSWQLWRQQPRQASAKPRVARWLVKKRCQGRRAAMCARSELRHVRRERRRRLTMVRKASA